MLAQGDKERAAQVLVRARDERDVVLDAHALIEANDLIGSFRNVMGLDCTISEQDDIFGFFVVTIPAATRCVTTWPMVGGPWRS